MYKKNKKRQIAMRKITFGLLFILVLLFTSYSYAIASTTFSISDIRLKNNAISELETEIADLEFQYSSRLDQISFEKISDYDLFSVEKIIYLKKNN